LVSRHIVSYIYYTAVTLAVCDAFFVRIAVEFGLNIGFAHLLFCLAQVIAGIAAVVARVCVVEFDPVFHTSSWLLVWC
jgi:hypothetical protein